MRKSRNNFKLAVGYMRTSAAVNVGVDKDSDKRQRQNIEQYAKQAGYSITQIFYDAAVSGSDAVINRHAFSELLDYIKENNIETVIVESADRLARDLLLQLTTHDLLKSMGVTLIAANAADYFTEETATAVLVRQVMGAIAQWEKTQIVAKLAAARKRKRLLTGKCGGRPSIKDTDKDATALAQALAGKRKRKMSLRQIAQQLAGAGYVSSKGTVFTATTVKSMIYKGKVLGKGTA